MKTTIAEMELTNKKKISIVALKEISNKIDKHIDYNRITLTISYFIMIILIASFTMGQVNHQERLKVSKDLQDTINKEVEAYDKVYNQLKKMELTNLEPERG